jgi:hypothetical protein
MGEVEQVRPFGVVQLERPRERVEDRGGHPRDRAAFELGVVLDAHPGEQGDFTAAQPGYAAAADVRQPRLPRSDLGAPRGQELANRGAIVHAAGIVEEVGSAVTTIRPGQFVVGSFFASDNTCAICRAGYQTSCINREVLGTTGRRRPS